MLQLAVSCKLFGEYGPPLVSSRIFLPSAVGNGWLYDYLLHRDYTHLSAYKAALKERREAAAKAPANGTPAYTLVNPTQQQAMPAFA